MCKNIEPINKLHELTIKTNSLENMKQLQTIL